MLKNSIVKLMAHQELSSAECEQAIQALIEEDNPVQAAAFLVLLRAKPESAAELTGLVQGLQKYQQPLDGAERALDIVGTGGDGANTLNISTASAILAAICGAKVVKHGNRAVSSMAGSADVLEALGIQISLNAQAVQACLESLNIGFCFAPCFLPVLAQLADLRCQLKVPTSLNLLGPLLNPAKPAHILLGVYQPALMQPIAETLQSLGTRHSMVVCGGCIDELSCLGPSQIMEIRAQQCHQWVLDPRDYGFELCHLEELKGGNALHNAQVIREIFSGNYDHRLRAIADSLVLNCAVALYLSGQHASIHLGVEHAREVLRSGQPLTLIKQWIKFSHEQSS